MSGYYDRPEDPTKLQGPEIGSLCLTLKHWNFMPVGTVVRVIERSYVWAPGQPGAYREYDWSVIEYNARGSRVVVNDYELAPLAVGDRLRHQATA